MFDNYWAWIPTRDSPGLLFDIETDGLLQAATTVHCIVAKDILTRQVWSFGPHHIHEGLDLLASYDLLVAHNGLCFDLPCLRRLFPSWTFTGRMFDTLTASRLIWTNIRDRDFHRNKRKTGPKVPPALVGRHSLEAWGHRLGILKGDYGKHANAWAEWSPAMQTYCEGDVEVLEALYRLILDQDYSAQALGLEHEFQAVIHDQEQAGVPFNVDAAKRLYADIVGERMEIMDQLQEVFPPKRVETPFTPKRNNGPKGYVAGKTITKVHYVDFNLNSRQHIAARLTERYGWQPAEYTPTGEPKLDEAVLSSLPYDEAPLLSRYLEMTKISGMLSEGDKGWLRLVTPQGRLHGSVITNGAVTGRCTHNSPNLAQIPKSGTWGHRCRALFHAPSGWLMVGADASGLELRMLAHYMARHDHGKYADVVVNGDVHTANMEAAGLTSRDDSKTMIYAFCYGAGDMKLGSIVAPHASPGMQTKRGKALRARFLSRIPALRRLTEEVKGVLTGPKKRGYLYGLDGRKLHIRSSHSALNTLLQGAGAVLVKTATVFFHWMAKEEGLERGKDYVQVLHVHDEAQFLARPEVAERVGALFVEAIERAGKHFSLRCPVTGEYKVGSNWAETH